MEDGYTSSILAYVLWAGELQVVELQVLLQATKGARVSFGSSLKHSFPAKLSTAPMVHHTELLSAIWDNNKTLFND